MDNCASSWSGVCGTRARQTANPEGGRCQEKSPGPELRRRAQGLDRVTQAWLCFGNGQGVISRWASPAAHSAICPKGSEDCRFALRTEDVNDPGQRDQTDACRTSAE